MNLDALLKYGMILEKSDHHTKVLEEDSRSGISQQANFINNKNDWRNSRDRNQVNKETERGKIPSRKCRNCGGSFPHEGGKLSCPAAEKKCFLCGKIGHFAKHCLSSPPQRSNNSSQNKEHFKPKPNDNRQQNQPRKEEVREIAEQGNEFLYDTDDEYTYTIITSKKPPEITVMVADVPTRVIVDTGSSVNLLNHTSFKKIKEQHPTIQLEPTTTKIFGYGAKQPLNLLGQFTAEIRSNSTTTKATFHVTQDHSTCLLSCNTSTALRLLTINVNAVSTDHPNPRIAQILQQHQQVFQGMGNLKNHEVKLEIDPSVQPIAEGCRRMPHSMRKQVNVKLQEMRDQDLIEKVEGTTPWLSPLIPIPKKGGDLRIVLDMRVPNQVLKRRRIQFPTVDEILHKMEGAKIFTEVDLSQGYLQISLAEESRYITAFQTPGASCIKV